MEKPFFFGSSLIPLQLISLVIVSQLLVVVKSDDDIGVRLVNVSKLEMFVDELPHMPKIQGYGIDDGVLVAGNLTIGMFEKYWKFHRDMPHTRVFAYGTSKHSATVPGPTIEAVQGIPTYVTWQNHLPSHHILPWDRTIATATPHSGQGIPTVVHLHGSLSSPSSDGHSHAWFTSSFASTGPTFSGPTSHYPNHQLPGNLWYHDHAMGLTRVNILSGLFGAYVIRSPERELPLELPSGPEFDRNLVVFDRQFAIDGSIYMTKIGNNPDIHPEWQPEYFGDAIIVNGKAWPYLKVQRRRYRFRILNASNARFYQFLLSSGLHFTFIGSDSNYLPRSSTAHSLYLAPSEIADVIIDFSESKTDEVVLLNNANAPFPDGDRPSKELGTVMKFVIEKQKVVDTSRVPKRLLTFPPAAVHRAAETRHITLFEFVNIVNDEPTHLLINFKSFDAPATETPKAGTSEIWELINLTEDNHPLHVHLGTFMVLDQRELVDKENLKACMNTSFDAVKCNLKKYAIGAIADVPKNERGWKNVFKLKPGFVTRILVRFSPLQGGSYPFDATAEPGYAYHCHILDHEDNEMMRPLKLVN